MPANGGTGTTANLIISGQTIMISNSSGNTLIFDLGGLNEHTFTYSGETISITINDNIFRITFTNWGSLLFTYENLGKAPSFSNLSFIENYRLVGETGYTSIEIVNSGINYLLHFDSNSDSIYNIKTNNVIFSSSEFQYTPIYLEYFSYSGGTTGTTTGTTLYQYYMTNYPTLDGNTLDNILKGVTPFSCMFKANSIIEIDDLIVVDELNSILMKGSYPLDSYGFKMEVVDVTGYTNIIRFNFVVY